MLPGWDSTIGKRMTSLPHSPESPSEAYTDQNSLLQSYTYHIIK